MSRIIRERYAPDHAPLPLTKHPITLTQHLYPTPLPNTAIWFSSSCKCFRESVKNKEEKVSWGNITSYHTRPARRLTWFTLHSRTSINPFIPKSDQYQISPVASQEILHHTVWRTWLFIAYSDARWLYYQLSLPSVIQFSLQGWENAVFELGKRVKRPSIKRSPYLKRSPIKVPEFASLNYCKRDLYLTVTSIKRTRSPFRFPNLLNSLYFTSIKRSLARQ